MSRKIAGALSLTLVLASCAPTATVGTGQETVQIPVLTGTPYALSRLVPLEQLTEQTPNDWGVTFNACQGGAVKVGEVRRYGPERSLQACQAVMQQKAEGERLTNSLRVLAAPFVLFGTYFLFKLVSPLGCIDAC